MLFHAHNSTSIYTMNRSKGVHLPNLDYPNGGNAGFRTNRLITSLKLHSHPKSASKVRPIWPQSRADGAFFQGAVGLVYIVLRLRLFMGFPLISLA